MFCSGCGRPVAPDAGFCAACGAPVAPPASSVQSFVRGIVAISLKEIVLFDRATAAEILKSPVFRFICVFALTPLLIQVVGSYGGILNGLAVWSGVFWAILLFRLFADRDLRLELAVGMLLFTAFAMMPLFEFYISLPPKIAEPLVGYWFLPVRYVGYVLGIGVREEMCKAIPLILLALFSARMKNPLNGLVLGMMSGIGFAVSENVYYVYKTLNQAIETTQATGNFSTLIGPIYNNVVRMMSGPFGHGVYSGIFGYFISLAAADRERRWPLFLAGLGVSSFLHGSYNTFVGVSPIWGVLIKAFNFFVLMTYLLKARGLTGAGDIAGGLFQRTVMRQMPEEVKRVAEASQPTRAQSQPGPPRPASPAPERTVAHQTTTTEPAAVDADATAVIGSGPQTWRLRGVEGAVSGSVHRLTGAATIGRDAAKCQIVLEESTVARQHALLIREPDGQSWRIKRLSTTRPLTVNGRNVDEAVLTAGDKVQTGGSVFVLEGETPTA